MKADRTISLEGVSHYYSVEGNGFPLIFIHGFCENHALWNEFVIPFTKNYRVFLPDLPGFGKSSMPGQPCSIDYYAGCIKAVLDAEDIKSCLMIGHSLGGYTTLNLVSRFPELLKGFALFHSSSYEDDDAKKVDRVRSAEFVRKNGGAPFINELYKKLFAPKYFDTHQQEIDALIKYAAGTSSVEGIAQASIAMANRKDTTEALKSATVPVLFIIGKEDKAISPEKSLEQTHLPERSVICLLEGVGHMGMYEATEETQKRIFEWLGLCLT